MTVNEVRKGLKKLADASKARFLAGYFKTGPGGYAQGDRFLGVTVPGCRAVARTARDLEPAGIDELLRSPVHEEREVALFILVDRFKRARTETERRSVYRRYLASLRHVNNWDLVDGSAPAIVGGYLADKDKAPLYRWARSRSLWERRIAVMATYHFIKQGRYADTLRIARILLEDPEDLIHKAVGWMLREVGNRAPGVEEEFLRRHYRRMPRTMLRYAIEKFPERKRRAYLEGRR
jgi:3-methyladenine DNA glycosylase AlkD